MQQIILKRKEKEGSGEIEKARKSARNTYKGLHMSEIEEKVRSVAWDRILCHNRLSEKS